MNAVHNARIGWLMAVALLVPALARGEPSTADKTAARALFEDARKLAAQNDYAQACPKFEASMKLDPGPGTQFNLANCYERIGRTASAWTLFLDVAAQMRADGQADREKGARA